MVEWRDIASAPYSTPVRVKVGDMTFLAKLEPDASMSDMDTSCDQWQAVNEGEHPPCWSEGACWESNLDGDCSMQPEGWIPPTPDGTGSGEVTEQQIYDWLTANCGVGLPYGEVTDMEGALHALAYVHRQIASTPSYKVHIGQCVEAQSGLLYVLKHLARQALSSTPKRDEEQAGEEAIERAALAIGEMIVAKSEEPQGRAEIITAEDCRDLARAALAAAHKEQS